MRIRNFAVLLAVVSLTLAGFSEGLVGKGSVTPGTKEAPRPVHRADGVVELPVSFAPQALVSSDYVDMVRWDFDLGGDFSDALGVEFDVRANDLSDFTSFMFHFFSGACVRNVAFEIEDDGAWHHVRVPCSGWNEEGGPIDRTHVTKLRFHANVIPGVRTDKRVKIEIRNLAKWRGDWSVVFVEPESLVRASPSEAWGYRGVVNEVISAFLKLGLDTPRINDCELENRHLEKAKIVVLPWNRTLPPKAVGVLQSFVSRGGKIVAFYGSDPMIMEKAGLKAKMISRRELGESFGRPDVSSGFLKRLAGTLIELRPDMEDLVVAARCRYLAEEAQQRAVLESGPAPKATERRLVWCHRPYALYDGLDWESSARELAAAGITDLLVNLAWGGIAYYDSKVLPVAPSVAATGDALEQCLSACHRQGIRVHVWKVNWKIMSCVGKTGPVADFRNRIRMEGRLALDENGKEDLWLCQTDPRNQDLEIAAMCELASKKGVDGIHFDYIRYFNQHHCFCGGCRRRFEAQVGTKVKNWPKDVQKGGSLAGRWQQFRRDAVTRVVAETAARVRKSNPGVEISAATFANLKEARDASGQDWPLWCEKGYLDFVCPMDYVQSSVCYRNIAVDQRRNLSGSKTLLFPGLGLSCWESDGQEVGRLARAIRAVRDLGFPGFAIYEVDPRGFDAMRRLFKGE